MSKPTLAWPANGPRPDGQNMDNERRIIEKTEQGATAGSTGFAGAMLPRGIRRIRQRIATLPIHHVDM